MGAIVIRYDALQTVCSCSGALAKAAQSYADNLSSKVDRRFDDITGGSSDCLNNASYLVQEKIKKLSKKAKSFQEYAKKVTSFADTARRVDKEVGDAIKKNSDCFAKDNGIKTPEWKQKLISWLVDLRNSNIVLDAIATAIDVIETKINDMMDNIRHWYHCEGGKEFVKVVGAAAGLLVAIAVAIAAWPAVAAIGAATGFLAAAGAILLFTGAVIGVVDALSHFVASGAAYIQKKLGKFGASRVSGRIDKLSDWIRIHNFGSAALNNITSLVGMGLDSIKFVSDIINIGNTFKELVGKLTPDMLKNFFRENGGLSAYLKEGVWHKVKCTDGMTGKTYETMKLLVDDNGNVKTRYTVRSVLRGLKAFVTDDARITNSGQGLRTMLINNLKLDWKGFKSSIGFGILDNKKSTGMGKHITNQSEPKFHFTLLCKRFADGIKYNFWDENRAVNMLNFKDAAKRSNAWKLFLKDHRLTEAVNFENYEKHFVRIKSVVDVIGDIASGDRGSFAKSLKDFYQGFFTGGNLWGDASEIGTNYIGFKNCVTYNFHYGISAGR